LPTDGGTLVLRCDRTIARPWRALTLPSKPGQVPVGGRAGLAQTGPTTRPWRPVAARGGLWPEQGSARY